VAAGTEIEVDDRLAIGWMDAVLAHPKSIQNLGDFVSIAACNNNLRQCNGLDLLPFGPHLHGHAQQLCERAPTMPINRLIDYPGLFAAQAKRTPAREHPSLVEAFKDAALSPTNILANTAGVAHWLDSLYQSRPATSVIAMDQWELVDANKTARKHAKGAKAKAKLPPRMVLRAKGKLPEHLMPEGAKFHGGKTRVPAPGMKTVSEALELKGLNKMKPISNKAYELLKGRANLMKFGGPALAFGPSAVVDVKNTVWKDGINKQSMKNLAVASAKSQSSNAVGFAAGIAGAALITAVGISAAPVVLIGGLVIGIGAQAGFGYFMLDDAAADLVAGALR
jgi:hypothetical protein